MNFFDYLMRRYGSTIDFLEKLNEYPPSFMGLLTFLEIIFWGIFLFIPFDCVYDWAWASQVRAIASADRFYEVKAAEKEFMNQDTDEQ
ncbi:MAG: hypothetical protein PUB89_04080 [Oscillospiraceae bacterium]|nr:hypothetical protein [Oscillospiraceae bacterium]